MNSTSSPHTSKTSPTNLPFTVVILGPTGSGKTAASLELARALQTAATPVAQPAASAADATSFTAPATLRYRGAEMISADSRAIYRGLDIGTAKPSPEEQLVAPHWGIDLVNPDERFTVADWKNYAEQKIYEIDTRGNLPVVVGGTGLYIDALIYGYSFTEAAQKSYSDRQQLRTNFLNIGVALPRETLRQNLQTRIDKMFTQELFDEATAALVQFGPENRALSADIYRFVISYLNGEISLEEAKTRAFHADWHLARRQLTWFKRNPEIIWLPPNEIVNYILNKI